MSGDEKITILDIANITPNKLFKVGQTIDVMIQEIDIENSRVAVSHKLTKENPFQGFAKKYPKFSTVKGTVSKIKDLSIFINIKEFDIEESFVTDVV